MVTLDLFDSEDVLHSVGVSYSGRATTGTPKHTSRFRPLPGPGPRMTPRRVDEPSVSVDVLLVHYEVTRDAPTHHILSLYRSHRVSVRDLNRLLLIARISVSGLSLGLPLSAPTRRETPKLVPLVVRRRSVTEPGSHTHCALRTAHSTHSGPETGGEPGEDSGGRDVPSCRDGVLDRALYLHRLSSSNERRVLPPSRPHPRLPTVGAPRSQTRE